MSLFFYPTHIYIFFFIFLSTYIAKALPAVGYRRRQTVSTSVYNVYGLSRY